MNFMHLSLIQRSRTSSLDILRGVGVRSVVCGVRGVIRESEEGGCDTGVSRK